MLITHLIALPINTDHHGPVVVIAHFVVSVVDLSALHSVPHDDGDDEDDDDEDDNSEDDADDDAEGEAAVVGEVAAVVKSLVIALQFRVDTAAVVAAKLRVTTGACGTQ